MSGPPPLRISGRIRRPIGVRIVRTCPNTNSTTGQPSIARFLSVTCIGNWPCDLPERIVRWPALAASNAMSAPECERPTTRTAPGRSWAGLRYSCECICVIDGSRSMAKSGTFGCRNGPVATIDLACSEALAVRGRHDEAAVDRLDAFDARPTPDRQVEPVGRTPRGSRPSRDRSASGTTARGSACRGASRSGRGCRAGACPSGRASGRRSAHRRRGSRTAAPRFARW